MRKAQRNRLKYNLSHLCYTIGHIGRLQTLGIYPVKAGDSLELSMDAVMRLAPTRREITSECQVDILGFYVPHRHVYGDLWLEFMNAGPDSTVDFSGTNIPIGVSSRDADYLCLTQTNAELPAHLVQGYNRIYQRFFAIPNTSNTGSDDQTDFTDYNFFQEGTDDYQVNYRRYGRCVARLPHILNGGTIVDNAISAAGFDLDLDLADTTVSAGTSFDIRALAEVQSRYESEIETTWFAAFYKDLLQQKFGTSVNIDADQRPEYLFRETMYLSGQDVNGTDDATLGQFVGKTLGRIGFHMRRKAFMEHGFVWVVMVPRYPLIHVNEKHPLWTTQISNYDYFIAEADRVASLAPVDFNPGQWLANEPGIVPTGTVLEPYGQQYRFQPNRVHSIFNTIPGYPVSKATLAGDEMQFMYYQNNEYADTFNVSQMQHWQVYGSVKATKFSDMPSPIASIFAGTR